MKLLDILEFQGNMASQMVLDTYSGAVAKPSGSNKGQIFLSDASSSTAITPVTSASVQSGVYVPTGATATSYYRLDNVYNTYSDILSNAASTGILSSGYSAVNGHVVKIGADGKLTGVTTAAFNASLTLAQLSDTLFGTLNQGDILIWNGTKWVDGNIVGTPDQINVSTATAGQIILSTPQDIAQDSTVTFGGLNVYNAANAFLSVGASASEYGGFNYDATTHRVNIGVNTNSSNANSYGPTSLSILNVASASATLGYSVELGSFIKLMTATTAQVTAANAYYTGTTIYKDASSKGLMYFDTTTSSIKFYDGTAWQSLLYGSGSGYIAGVTAGNGIKITGTSNVTITADITGDTAKGLTVTQGVGATTTILLDQSIKTTAAPTFASISLTNTSGAALTVANGASISLNGVQLTASATPTASSDVITYGYLQGQAFGLRDFKESVKFATTVALSVTATATTLTATAVGVLTIDGNALSASDVTNKTRILVKNQTGAGECQNGIYIMTTAGTASVAFVLTRADDFDSMGANGNISSGAYVYVSMGTANQKTGWIVSSFDSVMTTLGNTTLGIVTWTQFSGAGAFSAGTGIYISGTTINAGNMALGTISYGNGANVASATLAIGTAGQVMLSSGTTPTWGAITLSNAASVTGVLGVANGGTGLSSFTAVGSIFFSATTSTIGQLADVATGSALISGGVGVAPSWGKIGLTTHVSGTLPVANGGTGLASYTVGSIIFASGATTLAGLADVAVGSVLLSGGVGVAPAWGKVDLTAHVTGILHIANGGTGLGAVGAAGTVLMSTGSALAYSKVSKGYSISWNPSSVAATVLTAGPYVGSYQYVVNHALGVADVDVVIIDNSTGEILMASQYSTATLNVASPTYGSTSSVTVKFSAVGWAAISAKTAITIMVQAS